MYPYCVDLKGVFNEVYTEVVDWFFWIFEPHVVLGILFRTCFSYVELPYFVIVGLCDSLLALFRS